VNRYFFTVATGEIGSSKVNMCQMTESGWRHLVQVLPRGTPHCRRRRRIQGAQKENRCEHKEDFDPANGQRKHSGYSLEVGLS
jgi:hypothetical protein